MGDIERALGMGGLTRRYFLGRLGRMGGTAMLLAGMDALGLGIGSAMATPPKLQGRPKRNKVIVLGAGNAGLASAYELSQAGYDVTVIEARAFPGGRAQTARKGFTLTELGGAAQVCDFDEGLYLNHGPWRIPYHHHSTLHYTRKFGVPLELFNNDNDASYLFFEKAKGPLAGKPIRKGEIAADMLGHTSEILAKLSRQGALDDRLSLVLAGQVQYLTLDLERLAYISSAGVRSVFRARKLLEARGGKVLVANAQPQVQKVFDIVKAVPLSEIFRSVEESDAYLDRIQKKILADDEDE